MSNASGCVSPCNVTARVDLFTHELDALIEAAAAGVEPSSPNGFAQVYGLRAT